MEMALLLYETFSFTFYLLDLVLLKVLGSVTKGKKKGKNILEKKYMAQAWKDIRTAEESCWEQKIGGAPSDDYIMSFDWYLFSEVEDLFSITLASKNSSQ